MFTSILFIMLGYKLDMGLAYYILIGIYFMLRCLTSAAQFVSKHKDD